MESYSSPGMWISFSLILIVALVIDTVLIQKYRARSNETWRAALFWTLFWIVLALLFNLGLWVYLLAATDTATANLLALQFLTAYLVEKSLSVDNLFVFYLIFHHFHVPAHLQHRVLTYGIWGAIIMRLLIIVVGIWLVSHFHWLLYVMGAFLFFTGIKILTAEDKKKDLSESLAIKLVNKLFRVTHELKDESFFVVKDKVLYATPLFVVLIFIEFSDLVFAVDSIPAVFAITRNPLIVWGSNVFAILGLRAMYFVLARMVEQLTLLKYGIACILVYVGTKMMIEPWFKIPPTVSLMVILMLITSFSLLSYVYVSRSVEKQRG